MAERKHSVLSPSGAHRWITCNPSARLEETYPDDSSAYAEEGTDAHAWAAYLLDPEGNAEPVFDMDDEMKGYVTDYVAFVNEIAGDDTLMTEAHLDLSKYVPECWGYVDVAILKGDTLYIIDFKYGQGVAVNAYQNPQMMLYALGILSRFPNEHFETVNMTIYQPRRDNVSTWAISTDDLLEWADNVLKPAAGRAFDGMGEYVPGEHCQFCRARNDCKARAGDSLKIVDRELDTIPQTEIDAIMYKVPAMIAWLQDVLARAQNEAVFEGKTFPGMELVPSRTQRRIKDKDKDVAVERLINSGHSDLVRAEPETIGNIEKALGKKGFEELLGDCVSTVGGNMLLKPITQKQIKNK